MRIAESECPTCGGAVVGVYVLARGLGVLYPEADGSFTTTGEVELYEDTALPHVTEDELGFKTIELVCEENHSWETILHEEAGTETEKP